MSKLYIIGNGFDLKHDLPSRYSDFAIFCKTNHWELFEQINMLFPKISTDGLWSNFERGLGEVDESKLRKNFYEPHEKNIRSDEFLNMYYKLNIAFREWVQNTNGMTGNLQKHYVFDETDSFISFNYTNVLETIYGIKKQILHIHGYAKPAEKDLANYIFGHERDEKRSSDAIDSFDYLKTDFVNGLRKDYKTDDLEETIKKWENKGSDFCDIITLGHSLDIVDGKYFVKLLQLLPNAKWHIDYFDYSDHFRKMRNVSIYGITRKEHEFIRS